MLDYLRSLDVLSRASRKLVKAINFAVEEYMLTNENEPTDDELAAILDETVEKVHDARIASTIYTVMPLSEQLQVGDEGASLAAIEKDQLVSVIKTVLSSYKEREQMIIQLFIDKKTSVNKSLTIYPNPANEYINVELGGDISQAFEIEIVDIVGNVVLNRSIEPYSRNSI